MPFQKGDAQFIASTVWGTALSLTPEPKKAKLREGVRKASRKVWNKAKEALRGKPTEDPASALESQNQSTTDEGRDDNDGTVDDNLGDEASRFTTAQSTHTDDLRERIEDMRQKIEEVLSHIEDVMGHQEKIDGRLKRLSWRFTEILVLAAKKNRDDQDKRKED